MSTAQINAGDVLLQPNPVEEIRAEDLPYKKFLRDYVRRNRPVVVTNIAPQWPAMSKWTPEYFRQQFTDTQVPISYSLSLPMSQFIDEMSASSMNKPGPYMYRLFLHDHLRELLTDLSPQSTHAFPRRLASPLMPHGFRRPDGFLKLLMGSVGSSFPSLHFDADNANATVTEIYGDKEFILYAPEDSVNLYPNPNDPNKSLVNDLLNPDLTRFPRFQFARQFRTVLKPGSMVYVPNRWWHTARPLTPSISVGMNIIDRTNWSGFVHECCKSDSKLLKKLLRWSYLTGVGGLMSSMELLQEQLPGVARALVFPAKLCPASASVTDDPAGIVIHPKSRHIS